MDAGQDHRKQCVDNLARIIRRYNRALRTKTGLKGIPPREVHRMFARVCAAVQRAAPRGTAYAEHAKEVAQPPRRVRTRLQALIGIAEALRDDLKAGHLRTIEELIHGGVFTDFLEMAEHLLSEGYKDPAAVIAGSALESHVRLLCKKHRVSTETAAKGKKRPKKVDQMNSDLAKKGVYPKLDWKNVIAWYGLRSDAAHGDYDKYNATQVELMLGGIRDFIVRHPA